MFRGQHLQDSCKPHFQRKLGDAGPLLTVIFFPLLPTPESLVPPVPLLLVSGVYLLVQAKFSSQWELVPTPAYYTPTGVTITINSKN